jgi:hypothetical protein
MEKEITQNQEKTDKFLAISFANWLTLNCNITSINGEYLFNSIRYSTEELFEIYLKTLEL